MWYFNIGDDMKNKSFWFLLISIIVFIAISLFLEFNYVEKIDIHSTNINKYIPISFKNILLFITNIMSVIGITTILLVTSYILRKKNAQKQIYLFIITILSCLTITNLIKLIVKRERPLEQLLEVGGFSFPSSHSSISMVIYGFLILLIRKHYHGKYKNLYIGICITLIILTGFSRIYFNVHYITDVIAGFSLGLIILSISNFFFKKLTK